MIAPVVLIARKCQKCRKCGNRDQKLKFDRRDAVRPGTARACPVTNDLSTSITRTKSKRRPPFRRLFGPSNDKDDDDEWLERECKERDSREKSPQPTAPFQQNYSLANLLNQRTRVSHNPRHEFGRLPLLQRRKPLHARPRPDQLAHVLSEFPESRTILGQGQGPIPPNDLATHHDHGSIGIVG